MMQGNSNIKFEGFVQFLKPCSGCSKKEEDKCQPVWKTIWTKLARGL